MTEQTLAVGPAASQIAIKQLGTNGGGFFNVNSAHPFENPTPLSNFLELLAILLHPGRPLPDVRRDGARPPPGVGDPRRDGRDLRRLRGRRHLQRAAAATRCWRRLGVDQHASASQAGGNMEGKEVRFGPVGSALWATATTAASNGSVNSMHDSFTPLGGLVPMALMQIGEVVFGGVGSGLYGMLAFVIVAVFIAGLMVGRTPEYLGKKIGSFEMKMASLVILVPPACVLLGTALAVATAAGRAGGAQPGRARLLRDPVRVLLGRQQQRLGVRGALAPTRPSTTSPSVSRCSSAASGRRSRSSRSPARWPRRRCTPAGAGTLATHTPLFVVLLVGTVLLVAALTFFPALALGPDRRAPADARGGALRRPTMPSRVQALKLFEPAIVRRRDRRVVPEARPAPPGHATR